MMTMKDVVTAGYQVDEHGIIHTPGRLEGEPWWIVQVHEWDMDGDGDILSTMNDGCGEFASLHDVDADVRAAFGLEEDTVAIYWLSWRGGDGCKASCIFANPFRSYIET